MNVQQSVQADERTAAVLHAANTWGYNFILFALLIDIMYRSVFLHEAAWDLFAVIGVSGVVSSVLLARHKLLGKVFRKRMVITMAMVAIFAAVLSAFIVTRSP